MYYIFICKFEYAGVCVIVIHYISLFYFSLVIECLIYFIYKSPTLIEMVKKDIKFNLNNFIESYILINKANLLIYNFISLF